MSGNELVEDINTIRREVNNLRKLVEEMSKYLRELPPPATAAEVQQSQQVVLKEAAAATTFSLSYQKLAAAIQPHLTTPAAVETVLAGGLRQLMEWKNALPASIPLRGTAWGFANKQSALLTALLPITLLTVGLVTGRLFKSAGLPEETSNACWQAVYAEHERYEHQFEINSQILAMAKFYEKQVRNYQKKFPRSARYFPAYKLPPNNPVTNPAH